MNVTSSHDRYILCQRVAERGKCNQHSLFFVHGFGRPPSPSYYIRYVFPSSDVLLNAFLSYGPGFLKILYLQLIVCIRTVITKCCVKAQFGRSNAVVLREVSEMTLQPYFAQLIVDGRLHLH